MSLTYIPKFHPRYSIFFCSKFWLPTFAICKILGFYLICYI
ncbi:hypothetical protein ERO13_D05G122450v2 [Gossypium hirsutum]|uniref:Uncharacterized protein n=2 Tax=Gossypium TaxID=3633 RepID=A0A5D2KUA9_GOSTO|nr:hypothetical protein ERO13_D05G122450v2 [Gossypium hirsutum]TYG68144.1 hypothetical protein ES288_D05G130400v1 [Gossypium darwinii]TYH70658.1 hypothetical protein ES332_D05G131800v1 [Gossypium tomentosum]